MAGNDIREEGNNMSTKTSGTSDKPSKSHDRTVSNELEQLTEALLNDEEIYIDEEGILHTAGDSSGVNTLNSSNLVAVNSDPFASPTGKD